MHVACAAPHTSAVCAWDVKVCRIPHVFARAVRKQYAWNVNVSVTRVKQTYEECNATFNPPDTRCVLYACSRMYIHIYIYVCVLYEYEVPIVLNIFEGLHEVA